MILFYCISVYSVRWQLIIEVNLFINILSFLVLVILAILNVTY